MDHEEHIPEDDIPLEDLEALAPPDEPEIEIELPPDEDDQDVEIVPNLDYEPEPIPEGVDDAYWDAYDKTIQRLFNRTGQDFYDEWSGQPHPEHEDDPDLTLALAIMPRSIDLSLPPEQDHLGTIMIEDNADSIEEAFDALGIRLSFNSRTKDIMWDGVNSDSVAKRMVEKIGRVYKSDDSTKPWRCSEVRWHDLLRQIYKLNQFDPWQIWLEDLPDWDGTERYPVLACFEAYSEPYSKFVSMLPFIGAAGRLNPDVYFKFDYMVILTGAQGIAKSSFWALAMPQQHRDLFIDSVDFEGGIDKAAERSRTAVIAEVAEMHGMSRADVNNVKRFITTRNYKTRLPYDRTPTDCVPSWVLVGTANNKECIPWDAEARRFWPLEVRARIPGNLIDNYDYMSGWWDTNREQVWAEALYKARNQDWLKDIHTLEPHQKQKAASAMIVNDEQERISDWIDDWEPTDDKDYVTVQEIQEALFGSDLPAGETRRLRRYISNALTAAGFSKGKRFRAQDALIYPWYRA